MRMLYLNLQNLHGIASLTLINILVCGDITVGMSVVILRVSIVMSVFTVITKTALCQA